MSKMGCCEWIPRLLELVSYSWKILMNYYCLGGTWILFESMKSIESK